MVRCHSRALEVFSGLLQTVFLVTADEKTGFGLDRPPGLAHVQR
jgi:hypothetical protein